MRGNRLLPSTIGIFFEPKLAVPFLAGTTSLAIVSMALYDLIKDAINEHAFHVRYLLLAIVVLGILLIAAHSLKKRYLEATHIISPKGSTAPQKKALIVLGSEEAVVRKAIGHHLPVLERAWIIATDRDTDMARRVKDDFAQRGKTVEVRGIADPADWYETSRLVRAIVDQRSEALAPADIIVDITGMTKPASIGAFLGALQTGAQLQYTPRRETVSPQGTTREPMDPIRLEINYDVIAPVPVKSSAGQQVTL